HIVPVRAERTAYAQVAMVVVSSCHARLVGYADPWGNFWSLGASWIISQEKFMKDLTWIDNLKFRVSYGEVGNDAGADYYAYKELFYS
ncbi:hypothetical protein OSM86_23105, partial [Escherichia coli]|nr:hypothetical protein [Escherichia coli]